MTRARRRPQTSAHRLMSPGQPIKRAAVSGLPASPKAFSGAVALSLVSQGKLRLTDTIGRRVPALPRAWQRVTLRELLQHRSGLPDFSASKALARRLQRAPHQAILPGRLLHYVWHEPLQFRPGSRYKYDNSDNVATAMMAGPRPTAATGRCCESSSTG